MSSVHSSPRPRIYDCIDGALQVANLLDLGDRFGPARLAD